MSNASSASRSTPRIKLRGNGHSAPPQQQKNNSTAVSLSTKPSRPILRNGNRLMKGTGPLPGAGAPKGSQNYRNGRLVKNAFMAELAKVFKLKSRANTVAGLEAIAGKVIKLARAGSIPAAREVFDRIEGKPAQMIIGDPDNPVFFKAVAEMSDSELEQIARGYTVNGEATRVDE